MSDHCSGPRAIADPLRHHRFLCVPRPGQPGHFVLVMNVFPLATPSALFSDAVDYRFRLRPVTAARRCDSRVRGERRGVRVQRHLRRSGAPRQRRPPQAGTCTLPTGGGSFRVGDEAARRTGCGSSPDADWIPFSSTWKACWHRGSGAVGVRARGRQTPRGHERASHRHRSRYRQGVRQRGWPAVGRGRGDDLPRSPVPAGAPRPTGDQELRHGPPRRPRQPRPRDRDLYNMRTRSRSATTQGLPLSIQRQPGGLRRAGREDRLAARRAGRSSVDRAAAGRLPRRGRREAVRQGQLPRGRAGRARRPPAHDLRRPLAEPRHRRHPLHGAGGGLDGPRISDGVDQATRPPSPAFPTWSPPNPNPPDRRPFSPRVGTAGGGGIINALTQEDHRPATTSGVIAVANLHAQIDGLAQQAARGGCRPLERAHLVDLLPLRGQVLGRVVDYERAAELAEQLVGDVPDNGTALLARARTQATFHRFAEALADLDAAGASAGSRHPQRGAGGHAPGGRAYARRRAAASAAERRPDFTTLGALAVLEAERGEARRRGPVRPGTSRTGASRPSRSPRWTSGAA